MTAKKSAKEPPNRDAPLECMPPNIFRELCEHWTIGTLVKQAYEAIHTEDSVEPVLLVLGDTKIQAWYDEETEATHIQVGGEIQ